MKAFGPDNKEWILKHHFFEAITTSLRNFKGEIKIKRKKKKNDLSDVKELIKSHSPSKFHNGASFHPFQFLEDCGILYKYFNRTH